MVTVFLASYSSNLISMRINEPCNPSLILVYTCLHEGSTLFICDKKPQLEMKYSFHFSWKQTNFMFQEHFYALGMNNSTCLSQWLCSKKYIYTYTVKYISDNYTIWYNRMIWTVMEKWDIVHVAVYIHFHLRDYKITRMDINVWHVRDTKNCRQLMLSV